MAKEPSSLMVAFLDPLAIVGAAAWIFALVRTWRRDLPRPIVLGAAAWWLYVAARAARAAGLIDPASFVLVLLPALFVLARLGPYLRAQAIRARIFQLGVLLVLGIALLAPMAIQHEMLLPRARLPDAAAYLDRLGFGSPDVFVIAGLLSVWAAVGWAWRLEKMEARVGKTLLHLLIAGFAVIAAAAMFLAPSIRVPEGAARLMRALSWLPLTAIVVDLLAIVRARWSGSRVISDLFFRLLRYAEQPRVLVPGIAVLALVLSGMTIFKFLPELSYHVSQKHILDTYRQAEERRDVGHDIFRHGRFSSSAGSDHNFYIHSIPEVSSQSTVLDLLAAKKDASLRLTDSPFLDLPEHVVFRAFDAANDKNGDGRRDWPADAGVADTVEGGLLVDESRSWEPDQWKGGVVVDPSGRAHEVVSNTTNELSFGEPPWRKKSGYPDKEYRLDAKDAPNHHATSMEAERAFVVLPNTTFSALNFAFRRREKGRHIPVLDDRSSRLVLLSSFLQPGEEDRNWIAKAIITEEELKQEKNFQPSMVAFDDKLILEGVSLSESVIRRGGVVKAAFYFRVKAGVARSYKVFIHIDRPGTSHRIGVDHWVLNLPGHDNQKNCVGCLKTNEWLKGDVVADSFDIDVPLGTPSGPQHIWMGLYEPNGGMRLRVSDFDKETVEHDGHNRVRVAIFTVL
jgi:hypothetical protein